MLRSGPIRRYLEAGMLRDGLVSQRVEGTPQGGPLSPLLSNILLDDPDKELERRSHACCRYADDCNIYEHVCGKPVPGYVGSRRVAVLRVLRASAWEDAICRFDPLR